MDDVQKNHQLTERYEELRKQMQQRIDELTQNYEQHQPLKQLFALLQDDLELELLDQEMCELEKLLPDSYQYNS